MLPFFQTIQQQKLITMKGIKLDVGTYVCKYNYDEQCMTIYLKSIMKWIKAIENKFLYHLEKCKICFDSVLNNFMKQNCLFLIHINNKIFLFFGDNWSYCQAADSNKNIVLSSSLHHKNGI